MPRHRDENNQKCAEVFGLDVRAREIHFLSVISSGRRRGDRINLQLHFEFIFFGFLASGCDFIKGQSIVHSDCCTMRPLSCILRCGSSNCAIFSADTPKHRLFNDFSFERRRVVFFAKSKISRRASIADDCYVAGRRTSERFLTNLEKLREQSCGVLIFTMTKSICETANSPQLRLNETNPVNSAGSDDKIALSPCLDSHPGTSDEKISALITEERRILINSPSPC